MERIEHDTFGPVKVPGDKLWGAQTQRSFENFKISPTDRMPQSLIEAFGLLKKCAAQVNINFGLPSEIGEAIIKAAEEVRSGLPTGSLADGLRDPNQHERERGNSQQSHPVTRW